MCKLCLNVLPGDGASSSNPKSLLSFTPSGVSLTAYHSQYPRDRAIKAYRGRVRLYCKQGKSFNKAQRLALC